MIRYVVNVTILWLYIVLLKLYTYILDVFTLILNILLALFYMMNKFSEYLAIPYEKIMKNHKLSSDLTFNLLDPNRKTNAESILSDYERTGEDFYRALSNYDK